MQDTPRAPVGYGQGSYVQAETPKLSIRIRSGAQVGRGGYVGGERKPVAFVWLEEEAEVPETQVVVQVDHDGIYLWHEGIPASLQDLYPKEKAVARLAKKFEDWQRYFSKYYSHQTPNKFYWGRFHEEGRQLARRLQAELIDRAVVRYKRPPEDPQHRHSPEINL
jgi:hypothetical protein